MTAQQAQNLDRKSSDEINLNYMAVKDLFQTFNPSEI
jgi:hypothetical protein